MNKLQVWRFALSETDDLKWRHFMDTIHLKWRGPFSLAPNEGFDPPQDGGVYLFCVGRTPHFRVAYVGEAGNLRARMYSHLVSTLGGAYELYSDDHLVNGANPVAAYRPGLENLVALFIGDFARHSTMAYQNLRAYSFFWAAIDGDRVIRRIVESALITAFRARQEPMQNVRTSISPLNCRRLAITSSFESGVTLDAITQQLDYGLDEC